MTRPLQDDLRPMAKKGSRDDLIFEPQVAAMTSMTPENVGGLYEFVHRDRECFVCLCSSSQSPAARPVDANVPR